MRELVLGAGNKKDKGFSIVAGNFAYEDPTTLDVDPDCDPDVLWDLDERPLPFEDEEFDEIHAYEVLEHLGTQGDWRSFFEEFSEYARILKPGGKFYATVPMWNSVWAWGDPGHTRIINAGTLSFLNQEQYKQQVGKTSMTDYRHIYKASFVPEYLDVDENTFYFILRKD